MSFSPYYRAPNAGLVAFLDTMGGSGAALKSNTGYTFLSGKNNAHLAANAYYDGTNWQRYDVAAPATVAIVTGAGTVLLYTAAAGANPITWTTSTLAYGADSGWVNVGSYGTGWSAYDAGDHIPQYRKLPSGLVIFQGLVKKDNPPAPPETMFTILAGSRPAGIKIHNPANGAAVVTDMRVASSGVVTLQSGGSADWVNLADLSFFAEN